MQLISPAPICSLVGPANQAWRPLGLQFFPNSVSTLRGSCSRSEGQCLIRLPTLSPSTFPVNFCKSNSSETLTCVSTAKARAKARAKWVSTFWAGHDHPHCPPPPHPPPPPHHHHHHHHHHH